MLNDLRYAEHFLFTQYSLNTFDNCPLKFRKRYLENLKWDSFPDEEVKKRLEMGNDFHLLAYRYFSNTDTGLEQATESEPELCIWMERLKDAFEKDSSVQYLPEYKLRMISDGLKLEANFDLLVVRKDMLEIWDWKTHGANTKTAPAALEKKLCESLQTMVYLYVLKEQASLLLGREIDCEKITMSYWQPDPPRVVAKIRYDKEHHIRYEQILKEKIKNILEFDYAHFDPGQYVRHCKYCEFNWFCNNEQVDFHAMLEEEADVLEGLEWEDIEEKY